MFFFIFTLCYRTVVVYIRFELVDCSHCNFPLNILFLSLSKIRLEAFMLQDKLIICGFLRGGIFLFEGRDLDQNLFLDDSKGQD